MGLRPTYRDENQPQRSRRSRRKLDRNQTSVSSVPSVVNDCRRSEAPAKTSAPLPSLTSETLKKLSLTRGLERIKGREIPSIRPAKRSRQFRVQRFIEERPNRIARSEERRVAQE